MRIKRNFLITAISVITVSCIFYIGHFLFREVPVAKETGTTSPAASTEGIEVVRTSGTADSETDEADDAFAKAVRYEKIETEIGGRPQVINLLEIKLDSGLVAVKPALSFDLIYGFEKLSEIAGRKAAYAAVNGGFFGIYGEPAGLVAADGELFTASTGNYPVFVADGGKAGFREVITKLDITVNGESFCADGINSRGAEGRMVLYTPRYGTSNRAETPNRTYVIEDGKVTKVYSGEGETAIPKEGFLLTIYLPEEAQAVESAEGDSDPAQLSLNLGDHVAYDPSFGLGKSVSAYECGCMILKDGIDVSKASDPWVGTLNNWDPRTVIGIKDESTVVLMTVDGRQSGCSSGLTASETAEYLKSIGVKDAAMLDGGASTEMVIDGKTVNRPSNKGEGRKIAGAVVVVRINGNN